MTTSKITIGTDGRMTLTQGNAIAGKLPPINHVIIIHPNQYGQVCVMSRARVSADVHTCPLGCDVPSMLAREPGLTVTTVTDAVFTLIGERESLLGHLLGTWDGVSGETGLEVRGHQYDADRIIISIRGGEQEFTLTVSENK